MRQGVVAGLIAALLASAVMTGPAVARTQRPIKASPTQLARSAYARMSTDQRVGQLFMAGVTPTSATKQEAARLVSHQIGDVILDRNTTRGRHYVHRVTKHLVSALRTAGVSPFISTDQEGGEVQRLTGKGFARMPSALTQGGWQLSDLRAASRRWGKQLWEAGVDLDLAPVADTVPGKHASANQPIGQFDREYGHTPSVVATHIVAFLRGMRDAGVDTTVKHFPGLGRASGNTDTSPRVTDPTTRHGPYLKPYREAIKAGSQFVMVSSAVYPHIDAHHPACFSGIVITSMLRGDLHFKGVVISDDLGTPAMSGIPVGRRAVDFFAAGGTMLLDTSIGQLPAMIHAVLAEEATSPGFAKLVKAAVLNDLVAKARAGLIH
jgi:beta-N-acetylhexosaminidase